MISPGSILIKNGTLLPEPLGLASNSASLGWSSTANHLDGSQLKKALDTAGWTFFYMAGAIRRIAWGFEKQQMTGRALKSVLAAGLAKCNCFEVDDVTMHSFLGMQWVSVSGHSRHIQEGMLFAGQVT